MSRGFSLFLGGLLLGAVLASAAFALVLRLNRSGSHDPHSAAAAQRVIVLRLGHGLNESHPVHAAMLFMQERLSQKSGGTVELRIFPNGELGSEDDTVEQVQAGSLAMTKTSTGPLEAFVPRMEVLGLPYLFRDADHYWATLDGPIGRDLLAAGRDRGVLGLCYYDAGARSFYAHTRPILSPADLTAQTHIRVQKSATAVAMVEAMGGKPVAIDWGDLYSAFDTGAVEAAENNPPSYLSSRHFEKAPYFSLDEHTRVPDILLVSTAVWDGLPPHVQRWVQEAADESSQFERELWAKRTVEALDAVQEGGATISYPDKAPFRDAVKPIYQAIDGTDLGDLAEAIRKVGIE